jgi:hypothetical protein
MIWFLLSCGVRVGDLVVDDTDLPSQESAMPISQTVTVQVLLDGEPAADTTVLQGGNPERWTTDAAGSATISVDLTVEGDSFIMASHPEARIAGDDTPAEGEGLIIELTRFDATDNTEFVFQDPGTPGHTETSAFCGHCHVTLFEDWYSSAHRQSASNPTVQDLYAGAGATWSNEDLCSTAGGHWFEGIGSGTGVSAFRCYLGTGVLPALNACDAPCDSAATAYGACADCHAPGIDGVLGGRDLLDATGTSYNAGVHCDVCHHVESVESITTAAGVAGRLHIVRPSEDAGFADESFEPLTFGPFDDVPNPRMGSVARPYFSDATLCSGCHELDQPALLPDQTLDVDRWPTGTLPIHSTFSEWTATSATPCQDCHMPPDPDVGNAADLGNVFDHTPGVASGWHRPADQMRRHAWFGPRRPESGILQVAATVEVGKVVQHEELVATVTVSNVGAGHALPTGEPLRSLLLVVEASCAALPLTATGGMAIPDFGGALDRRTSGQDWSKWPGAVVGQVVRVVERTGEWHDYEGFGPFGNGQFSAAEKGMPVERVVGEATILSVTGDTVIFDQELPEGDIAYRTTVAIGGAAPIAGRAGFGFAKVLTDAQGERMVPHFLAVDVASDNRLLPGRSYTTEHRFRADCADPEVTATLIHRAYPYALAIERGWELVDSVMTITVE